MNLLASRPACVTPGRDCNYRSACGRCCHAGFTAASVCPLDTLPVLACRAAAAPAGAAPTAGCHDRRPPG